MSFTELSRLIVLHLAVNGALLAAAARLSGTDCRAGNLLAGAALGAACTAMVFHLPETYVSLSILRLAAAPVMVLLLTAGKNWGRTLTVFLLLSCTLAGSAALAGGLTGRELHSSSGFPATAEDGELLLFCGAGLYLASALWTRQQPGTVSVLLTRRGRRVLLRVLEDTGSTLRDPVSGNAVLIVQADAVAPLFPGAEEVLRSDAGQPVACLETLSRLGIAEGFSLLPYRALGTEHGLLLAARVDEWEVRGQKSKNRLIALTSHDFSGMWQGLMGLETV